MSRFAVALLLFAVAVSTTVDAARQGTRFSSISELAMVDVLAVDRDGNLVRDLTASDLSVEIDKQRRPVRVVQFMGAADRAAVSGGIERNQIVSAGSASLSAALGARRRLLLLVDTESTIRGSERLVIDAAAGFAKGLEPSDELTVETMPFGSVVAEPSTPRDQAVAKIQKIAAFGAPSRSDGDCNHDPQARMRLDAVNDTLRGLPIAAGPWEVVYVAGGLPAASQEGCSAVFSKLRDTAQKLRARFFVMQPSAVQFDVSSRARPVTPKIPPDDGLQDLAGMTGGQFFRISARAEQAFSQVMRATAGRWLLGFEPVAGDRDGWEHALKVESSRRGVTVIAATTWRSDR